MPSAPASVPRHANIFNATQPMAWDEELPGDGADYDEVIAALAAGDAAALPDQTGRKRVLVVDQDISARLYLRAKLSLVEGIDVYEAASSDEAVHISQTAAFDGVLLEVAMDGHNGYAVCRAIKRHSREQGTKPPKIYFVTSHSGLLNRLRARWAGADAFLPKPPHPAHLTRLLGEL